MPQNKVLKMSEKPIIINKRLFMFLTLPIAVFIMSWVVLSSFDTNDTFTNKEPEFIKIMQQRSLVNTLKESLPVYYQSLMSNPELNIEQKQSLEFLYLPVINKFIETGEIHLIDKSNTIKHSIINGTLRATIKKT